MAIYINHDLAKEILLSEHAAAIRGELPGEAIAWRERVQELGRLCPHSKSSTVIAALGTALLAKATDPRVDVYSLLVRGEAATSYSARSLADNVWARYRARLEVDLGANGMNPLNNTPFIGKTRIDEISGVRNQEGWNHFLGCLEAAMVLSGEREARLALRGFIVARRRSVLPKADLDRQLGDNLSMDQLARIISEYVSLNSEGGRRAQACAAGILDGVFGKDSVIVGGINDPDRRTPLDVAIVREGTRFGMSFEVKDKPISDTHIQASVEKTVIQHGTTDLGFLAVGSKQKQIDFSIVMKWAAARGVKATVFVDWPSFLLACRCFAPSQNDVFEGRVFRQIIERAHELGVDASALKELVDRARDPKRS
jgi:hypothetical protein